MSGAPAPVRKVLILGNPTTGKTTLFHRLCRRCRRTAGFQDVSTAIGQGTLTESGSLFHLIDTPGVSSIVPESEDWTVSRDFLLKDPPDVVALVADGKNLRKSLLLASQLVEFGVPMLLDINMMDEVRQRGIRIDTERLFELVGAPIVTTIATEGEGIGSFRKALTKATLPNVIVRYSDRIESAISSITQLLDHPGRTSQQRSSQGLGSPARAVAVALLSSDQHMRRFVIERWGKEIGERSDAIVSAVQSGLGRPLPAIITEERLRAVDQILSEVQTINPPARIPFSETIGEWSRRPLTGIPIAVIIVGLMYLLVGKLGAQILVGLAEGKLFGEWVVPSAEKLLASVPIPFVVDALVGEFGLISVGLTLAFGVVVPVLMTFFLAFGILEDSGYLPRLSVLLDRLLRKVGLNGKGILPLVLGFSCITMAILTTRILETKRERFIATLLLTLGLPCAPLLAVMLVLLTDMSIWASITVFGVLLTQIILIGALLDRFLPGHRSDFLLELPPMRIPRLRNLIVKTYWRVWWFIKEAVPMFLLATFILFLLERIGTLAFLERAGKPVMTGLLGLPPESIQVVMMTLIRRESGAALLKQFSDTGLFDGVGIVVCLLVLTFLSPCVNAILVMLKERGLKATLMIMGFVTPYALLVGAAVNGICRLLGVSFK